VLKNDLEAYLARYQAVREIERQEARSASIELRWRQLNSIYGLSKHLYLISKQQDQQEELVWRRWQELRERIGGNQI